MGYITKADARAKVWKVTTNQVSDDMLDRAIDMAAADIDSALGAVYSVPFAETYPEVIVAINNALVRYYGQFIMGHAYKNISEPDVKAYEWAQEKLEALRTGKATIPGVDRLGAATRCSTSGYHQTFDRDDPKYWGEDGDRLDDISDGRDS